MSARIALLLAGILGATGVAAGAIGAHLLKGWVKAGRLEADLLEVYHTAANYQMYHALALFGTGLLLWHGPRIAAAIAGWSFLVGTLLFSGSLYGYVLSGKAWSSLVAVTPIGGVLMILGWVALIVYACCSWPRD